MFHLPVAAVVLSKPLKLRRLFMPLPAYYMIFKHLNQCWGKINKNTAPFKLI